MSDSPSKPEGTGDGDGARKRRRRRRKPAGGAEKAPQASRASDAPAAASNAEKKAEKASSDDKRPRKRRSRRRGGADGQSSDRPQAQNKSRDSAGRESKKRDSSARDGKPRNSSRAAASKDAPARSKDAPARSKDAPARSKDAPARAAKPVDESWQLTPPPPADLSPEEVAEDAATLKPGDAAWGDDSAAETPEIQLKANLPADVAKAEWDPVSAPLGNVRTHYDGALSARIANVIAVRFVPAGRLYLYDGGDEMFSRGDRVMVEGDHGKRIATVGTASVRQPPKRTLKRILRRATAADLGPDREAECGEHLRTARDLAKSQGLPIKVFRAQFDGPKRLSIYYACEQKTDVRALGRAISKALPVQVELRHTGARDEAKMVGGIGSCGQELCCTTWLPAFVPVSIKNAKDQGLVLNPTKVSGQCGRLKCCLVYEQAHYSEMRKGLPKLGKRVITNDGFEGRVIEVDVLHQKIRVGIGRGESKVYGKGEVEPMFASQPQTQGKGKAKANTSKGRQEPGQADAGKTKAAAEAAAKPADQDSPSSDVTKEASNDQD